VIPDFFEKNPPLYFTRIPTKDDPEKHETAGCGAFPRDLPEKHNALLNYAPFRWKHSSRE
jgi:hypothetical protein